MDVRRRRASGQDAHRVAGGRKLAIECHRLSSSACQRDIECCAGIEQCRFSRSYRPGEHIFHHGDDNDGFRQLLSGLVGLKVYDECGRASLVQLVRPGELFGHRSFLANERHGSSAFVIAPTQVWHVPRPVAARFHRDEDSIRAQLSRDMAVALRHSREATHRAVIGNVRERALRLFYELAGEIGETAADGGMTLTLPLNYNEIAGLLGHCPETLSRALRRLADEGSLSYSRHHVTLPPETVLAMGAS